MKYTKNGSYPVPHMDNTPGWALVPDPPSEIPEGKELTWENWEWIIRDPRPINNPGFVWKWNHENKAWIEYPIVGYVPPEPPPEPPLEP
jgi:hypothetical protein